jgi:hypothetical protein
MRRNDKSLKKNAGEHKGILSAPSSSLVFLDFANLLACVVHPLPHVESRLWIQISRHGWQADLTTPSWYLPRHFYGSGSPQTQVVLVADSDSLVGI